jgi:hypothetical protein
VEIQAAISIDFKAFTYLNDSFRVHLRPPHVSHKGHTEMADPQIQSCARQMSKIEMY